MRKIFGIFKVTLFHFLMKTSFSILAFVLMTSQAKGHVRWFIKDVQIPENVHFTLDNITIIIFAIVLVFAISAALIHLYKANPLLKPMERIADGYTNIGWRIIGVLAGAMLIGNILTGVYLAPNMIFENDIMYWFGVVAQLLIAVLLIFQISFSISGVLIIVGGVVALLAFPFGLVIDYLFEFVLLGICLIILGPKFTRLDKMLYSKLNWDIEKHQHLPLPLIRIAIGLSLVVLAVHNKLMNPAISVAFLNEYPINFIYNMGFKSFTNLHFVLFAGILELTFGALITTGIATRYMSSFLSVFFIVTIIHFGVVELIGHAPLIAIVVLLIIQGSGSLKNPNQLESQYDSQLKPPLEPQPQV